MQEAYAMFHAFLGTTGKRILSVSCIEHFGRKNRNVNVQVMVLQRLLGLKSIPAENLLNSRPSDIDSPVASHRLKCDYKGREASAHLYLDQTHF